MKPENQPTTAVDKGNLEPGTSKKAEDTNPSKPYNPYGGPSSRDGFRGIITTALLFVAALVVAFLLTAFVFQQYEVDGPSMETTLQNQDRLIVVKLPKTWSKITGHPYIPPRGTIIVFNEGGLYNAEGVQEKQLIKRVIGLPGDRVVVQNGKVTIYNSANPNGFAPDKTMAYGKVITFTSGNIDIVVQPKNVFVMGDNRPDSLDSRYFGQVPVKNIIGKLDVRIYPFNTIKVF
jgi:signal peptidase I